MANFSIRRTNIQLGFSQSRRVGRWFIFALCLLMSALMLVPLAWLLRSSVMGSRQIFTFPPEWIPNPWRFDNYSRVFEQIPLLQYFANTLGIVVPVIVGTVITASISAYGFSRLRWPGRDAVFGLMLTTLMLPYAVTLIPTFLLWTKFGLTNTTWPLITPSWFGGGVFSIFLLRQFFQTIPHDLDEAATIDGANPLQVLWYVVIPVSRPALITIAIFAGLNAWNDLLGPLIYLNDPDKYTLAVGLASLTTNYFSQWDLLMAASTMVMLPVLVLFFFAQRYFVEGITLTGIKG